MQSIFSPGSFSLRVYFIAFGTVVGFVGLQHLLSPVVLSHAPLATLIFAIGISAWIGGRGPGLFATATAAILGNFFFLEPYHSFLVEHQKDAFRLGLFTFEGCALSWLIWKYREHGRLGFQSVSKKIVAWFEESPLTLFLATILVIIPLSAWGVLVMESTAANPLIVTFEDSLWWAVGTIFRVGYGDHVPVTFEGRALGVFLMFISYCSIGLFALKLVLYALSSPILPLLQTDKSLWPETDALKDHTVIFGWNPHTLAYIHRLCRDGTPLDSIFVILLQNNPSIKKSLSKAFGRNQITILNGDFSTAEIQNRLNLKEASSIAIFSKDIADNLTPEDSLAMKAALLISTSDQSPKLKVDFSSQKLRAYASAYGIKPISNA